MTMALPLWLLIGTTLGGLHLVALWSSIRPRTTLNVTTGIVRLLVVACVLTGVAIAGGIVPVSIGLGTSFLAARLLFLRTSVP